MEGFRLSSSGEENDSSGDDSNPLQSPESSCSPPSASRRNISKIKSLVKGPAKLRRLPTRARYTTSSQKGDRSLRRTEYNKRRLSEENGESSDDQKRSNKKDPMMPPQQQHVRSEVCTLSKRKKRPHPQLLFQDDKSGRRRINPLALRSVLDMIHEETTRNIHRLSRQLTQEGEAEESKRVQVRSRGHVDKIVSNVRRHFRQVMIPERYVKLIDACEPATLRNMNDKLRENIAKYKEMAKRLEAELKVQMDELANAQERKDALLQHLKEPMINPNEVESDNGNGHHCCWKLHPLLTNVMEAKMNRKTRQEVSFVPDRVPSSAAGSLLFAPVHGGYLQNLFQSLKPL